ncbi:MAG: 3-hydroxybenzoate--CoA/4-hydroxybenzoate--CoA ligase [Firmicutes bacterium ADurb.Bin080]|jgi:long-chain acyl-CoA synthetase|nr:acyl--CoA ligase [Clostridiales bacterium]OQC15354.1 MAG: 3-hydroxybenzoate--CoA/4-hydroxybenzoate--CoA ligase [Firmicutes bacterium ADurb.Bin080]
MNINQSMWSYFLEGNGEKDRVKLIYFGRKICLSEMTDSVLRTASFLKSRGVAKGDVVGIMLPNIPEAVLALYAINSIGGIASFIDPRIGELALYKIAKTCKPKVIFIFDMVFKKHKDILNELGVLPILCNLFTFAKSPINLIEKITKIVGFPYYLDTLKNLPIAEVYKDEGTSPAVYVHSGGTTGEPKTAVFNSKAFNCISRGVELAIHSTECFDPDKDSMLMMLPIFHSFGLGVSVHGILKGITAVLMPRFNADKALKLIGKYGVTHLSGIPYMYRKMMQSKYFNKKNVSPIKYIFCGGDRLIPEFKKEFNRKIKELGSEAEILEGYGLTETASVVTVTRKGTNNLNTQGQPIDGNEIVIVDKNGAKVKIGEVGEIHVKSDSIMIGYLNDKETNSKVIYKDGRGERWLKTSDLGRIDSEGLLYFSERENRTFKIAANMVFPSAIEAIVNSLEEVSNCCAARAIDKEGKPFVKLFVVPSSRDSDLENLEDLIKSQILKSLTKYDVPREIEFVSMINMTPFGKADYKSYETNYL